MKTDITCVSCGKQLIKFRWNEDIDMLCCNNTGCRKYRNPMPTGQIPKRREQRIVRFLNTKQIDKLLGVK